MSAKSKQIFDALDASVDKAISELWNSLMVLAPQLAISISTMREQGKEESPEPPEVKDVDSMVQWGKWVDDRLARYIPIFNSIKANETSLQKLSRIEGIILRELLEEYNVVMTKMGVLRAEVDKYLYLFAKEIPAVNDEDIISRFKNAGGFLQYILLSILMKQAKASPGSADAESKGLDLVKDRILGVSRGPRYGGTMPLVNMMMTYGLHPGDKIEPSEIGGMTVIDNTFSETGDQVRYDLDKILFGKAGEISRSRGITKELVKEMIFTTMEPKERGGTPGIKPGKKGEGIVETTDGGRTYRKIEQGTLDVDPLLLSRGPKRRLERRGEIQGRILAGDKRWNVEPSRDVERDLEITVEIPRGTTRDTFPDYAFSKILDAKETQGEKRLIALSNVAKLQPQFQKRKPGEHATTFMLPVHPIQAHLDRMNSSI